MSSAPRRWAVIGGGMLGPTLAYRLARAGQAVHVYEAAPHPGGLADAWSLGPVVWDRHYHVTLLSDTALRGLLDELGLEAAMVWATTRTGFYAGGRLVSLSSTLDFLRFPLLGPAGKVRLAATILYAAHLRDPRGLERVSAADWLRRWSGRRTFERIWRPLLRAKLGEAWPEASAAFIWAIIARMYAARRSGLKREMFGYVPGGYGRILERLVERLRRAGVSLTCGEAARRVAALPGRRVGVAFASGARERFDEVVLTVPAPVAARLCEGLTAGLDPWVPFTAVIEMSALVRPAELRGHALVYLPKYVSPADPAFHLRDDRLREGFLAALCRMYPRFRPAAVRAFRVSRVKHVPPISTPGYSERLPPLTTSVPGVHAVNSAHIVNGTLNVNEVILLAERAAQHLLAAAGVASGGERAPGPPVDAAAALPAGAWPAP